MNAKMTGTIRVVFVVLALAGALSATVPAALAGPPNASPATIAHYGFENSADSFAENTATPNWLIADFPTSAYWGRTLRDHYTGSNAFWCAGTSYPAGTTSTAWPYYLRGTRGEAGTKFAELAEFYSVSVSMKYKLQSMGADDYCALVWREYLAPGVPHNYVDIPISAAWRTFTYDLSASYNYPRLSRVPASLSLAFYDHTEGSQSNDTTGTGAVVDDFTVLGYKYGPIRSVNVSSPAYGQVALSWPVPYSAAGSNIDDTRAIAYRVWRAGVGTDSWIELTEGSREATNSFTDTSAAVDGQYKYVVQAWDSGVGDGRGRQSSVAVWPPQATLSAPSRPSGTIYMWTKFTSSGSIEPTHAIPTAVTIECSRNKSTIAYSYSAAVSAGSTTYSAVSKVKLPAAGTWYMRARHVDLAHGLSYSSTWTTVTVSNAIKLYAPHVRSTMYRNHTYSVYGYIIPRHTATYLRVYAYRWNGHRYAYVKSFSVKVTNSGQPADRTKYKASVKFTSRGYWKLRVKHRAHAGELTKYSSYSSRIKVK